MFMLPLKNLARKGLRAITQQVPKLLFCKESLKIIVVTLLPHLPGVNEFSHVVTVEGSAVPW